MSGAVHPLPPVSMAYKEYSYMKDVSDLSLYYQVIRSCYTKADLRIRGDGRYLTLNHPSTNAVKHLPTLFFLMPSALLPVFCNSFTGLAVETSYTS